jgi:hypothetical protein
MLDSIKWVKGMKKTIFLFFLTLLFSKIYANDAWLTASGGNYSVKDNKNTDVQMVSEIIKINMYENYCEFDILFDFYNYGDTVTLSVGFPEYSWGTETPGKIRNFKSYINNRLVKFKYQNENNNFDKWNYTVMINGWYVKEVTFEHGQHLMSRVIYESDYAGAGYPHKAVDYLYGTGKTWKNEIGKMTIEITNNTDYWIKNFRLYDTNEERNPQVFNTKWINDKLIIELNNIIPSDINSRFSLIFSHVPAYSSAFDTDHYLLLHEHVMDKEKWKYLTLKQLRIVRNSIYAHHGRIFQSQDLMDYFINNEWSSDWYNPNNSFSEGMLSNEDRENIKNIQDEENRRKK